jgi:hypothetical protein
VGLFARTVPAGGLDPKGSRSATHNMERTGREPRSLIDDVGAPVLDAPDIIGVSYIRVPVTNNSSKASSYIIEIAVARPRRAATSIATGKKR